MFHYSVRSYDEITREFGSKLNGFLPVVEFNISERGLSLQPSDLGTIRQFNKGYDRLKSWLNMAGLNPDYRYNGLHFFWSPVTNEMIPIKYLDTLDKLQKSFCLAALIIYFQVFGDGNHRAANYFFNLNSGRNLTQEEKNGIHEIYQTVDYALFLQSRGDYTKYVGSILENVIQSLVIKFNKINRTTGGKGYKRKTKNKRINKRRNYTKKKATRRSRKYSRSNK